MLRVYMTMKVWYKVLVLISSCRWNLLFYCIFLFWIRIMGASLIFMLYQFKSLYAPLSNFRSDGFDLCLNYFEYIRCFSFGNLYANWIWRTLYSSLESMINCLLLCLLSRRCEEYLKITMWALIWDQVFSRYVFVLVCIFWHVFIVLLKFNNNWVTENAKATIFLFSNPGASWFCACVHVIILAPIIFILLKSLVLIKLKTLHKDLDMDWI